MTEGCLTTNKAFDLVPGLGEELGVLATLMIARRTERRSTSGDNYNLPAGNASGGCLGSTSEGSGPGLGWTY